MTDPSTVRTRFAPSPSGHLHVGGARTALFCWAYARGRGGRFILRIEDTDRKRSSGAASLGFLEDLAWLGIDWDEGPEHAGHGGGDRGPYYQSERREHYDRAIDRLIAAGRAYRAFETPEELDEARARVRERGDAYRYDRAALTLTPDEVAARLERGAPHVVRFRVPDDTAVVVHDVVLGDVTVNTREMDDFVIRKADGYPTYHFAVVVDDELMGVTHIIRGQEHLNNSARHVLLQDALEFARPVYAHLSLIFNPDGSKMSKRDKDKALREAVRERGVTAAETVDEATWAWWRDAKDHQLDLDVAARLAEELALELPEINVDDFRRAGYLPEVLVNYLALLGWSPGADLEQFDRAYLVEHFDLDRVSKAPAKFDRDKLLAFNLDAIQAMTPAEFAKRFGTHVERYHPEFLARLSDDQFRHLAEANQARSKTLEDPIRSCRFFVIDDDAVVYEKTKPVRKALLGGEPNGCAHLAALAPRLRELSPWTTERLEAAIGVYAEAEAGGKLGKIAQPLRIAVSGGTVSPAIFDTLAILGREAVLQRIDRCLAAHQEEAPPPMTTPPPPESPARDFIRDIIADDLAQGRHDRIVTRFPPEPNGFLHIGHAAALCLDFGVAAENGGVCHLRFDDTNPCKEERVYGEAIQADVRWLGFAWDHLFHTSDYFERLYQFAEELIEAGKAYVCSLSADESRAYRGTLTEPGRNSPYRDRGVAENLDLFRRMRSGEFDDGAHVLRARIDMASPNLNLRDPTLYRIRRATHHRTGDAWCIYPMYDFAHTLSDSIEHITHSLCTLEFKDHRPLYEWLLASLDVPSQPRQIEFGRVNLGYTVMSKRRLLELVDEGHVDGWDDPRMPTLSGLRRRGYTPESIRAFCDRVGLAKRGALVDPALLEHSIREDLNRSAPRVMAVLRPLRVVIENYPEERPEDRPEDQPEDQVDELEAVNNPEDPAMGTRRVPFSRVLYVERDDFMEDPPRKFFRLAPGREVRLRYAYYVTCTGVVKDEQTGEIIEVRCTYDPATRGGSSPDGRKVKSTIHWVSAAHAVEAEVRLYDRLFVVSNPTGDREVDFRAHLNPHSLETVSARIEPSLRDAEAGARYQFERLGYFCVDAIDSRPGAPVFNRTVTLRDAWARTAKGGG